MRRFFPLVCCSIGLLSVLSACGRPDPAESLDEAAQNVSEAVESGDFGQLEITSDSHNTVADASGLAQERDEFRSELVDAEVSVSVGETTIDDPGEDSVRSPTAEVTLKQSWDLSNLGAAEPWEYTTTAQLRYAEDTEQWQLLANPDIFLPDYDGDLPVSVVSTAADRGRIMDDAGRAMVYNRDVVRIGLDKTAVVEDTEKETEQAQAASARELADVVGIDPDSFEEQVAAAGDEALVEAIALRADSTDVNAAEVEAVPGSRTTSDTMPLAESSDFAPLIVGRVGPVTAEALEEDPSLNIGETIGTSGLQANYQNQLRGTAGMQIMHGEDVLFRQAAEAGEDIDTSINPQLQRLAQSMMSDQDASAAIVSIRPSDGGILAAASYDPDESFVEMSLQNTFAPGSTFKLVSALALIRDGIGPDTSVQCPESTTINGQQFTNYTGYPTEFLGQITMEEAMAASCNTIFANSYDDVNSEELRDAARDLGFDNENPIGISSLMGSIPEDSQENELAADLFGQGGVEASPLAMATVAASIQAGNTVHPYIVKGVEKPDMAGELSESEAQQLQEMMAGTVDYGSLEFLEQIPGAPVYAKTGTAEHGGDDPHTWVTAAQDDLAVAIFISEGDGGASTNGPLMREFFTEAQDILSSSTQ